MVTFADEQAAFERALPGLMSEHSGQWVLYKGGAVGFFRSFPDAFNDGVRRFGVDTPFVIAEVKPLSEVVLSPAFTLGVMFRG